MQVTFADQLGAAKHNEGEVGSKNEAKKLAFYLFWNIKPYFDRYAHLTCAAMMSVLLSVSGCVLPCAAFYLCRWQKPGPVHFAACGNSS